VLENSAQSMQAAMATGLASPALLISAVLGDRQIRLAISDNGQGIDPEQQARIFAPFYSTRPGQLGMGLWLARRLAGRFGGTINCESEPGRTTFTMTIPLPGESNGGS